jgi:Carboxypeptidase regulatory-like domain
VTTHGCGVGVTAGLRSLAIALGLVLTAAPARPALAQSLQSSKSQRTLEGMVRDAAGQPLSGAIVYLENLSSLAVKTYVTSADGDFHFGQVGMDSDYEIYAEAGGKKTKIKRISAFNNKKRWTIDLTVGK